MSDFEEKLAALCSAELAAASRDADRMGTMLERLSHHLGLAIAVSSDGEGERIDSLMTGVEGYIHSSAVDSAKLARFMKDCRR